jgi:hypothetical protein
MREASVRLRWIKPAAPRESLPLLWDANGTLVDRLTLHPGEFGLVPLFVRGRRSVVAWRVQDGRMIQLRRRVAHLFSPKFLRAGDPSDVFDFGNNRIAVEILYERGSRRQCFDVYVPMNEAKSPWIVPVSDCGDID